MNEQIIFISGNTLYVTAKKYIIPLSTSISDTGCTMSSDDQTDSASNCIDRVARGNFIFRYFIV